MTNCVWVIDEWVMYDAVDVVYKERIKMEWIFWISYKIPTYLKLTCQNKSLCFFKILLEIQFGINKIILLEMIYTYLGFSSIGIQNRTFKEKYIII